MINVQRIPDLDGDQVEFNYLRDPDTGARTPMRYRVADGPWITDEAAVGQAHAALFARDDDYAQVMGAIAAALPGGVLSRRLDVGGRVVIGLSAEGVDDASLRAMGQGVIEAVLLSCGSLIATGRVAILWAD